MGVSGMWVTFFTVDSMLLLIWPKAVLALLCSSITLLLILHFNKHWWCTYYVPNTKLDVCVKIYLPFRVSFNTPRSFCVNNLQTGPTHPLSAQTWLCALAPFCFTPQGQRQALAASLDVLWLQGSPRVMTDPSGLWSAGQCGLFSHY